MNRCNGVFATTGLRFGTACCVSRDVPLYGSGHKAASCGRHLRQVERRSVGLASSRASPLARSRMASVSTALRTTQRRPRLAGPSPLTLQLARGEAQRRSRSANGGATPTNAGFHHCRLPRISKAACAAGPHVACHMTFRPTDPATKPPVVTRRFSLASRRTARPLLWRPNRCQAQAKPRMS